MNRLLSILILLLLCLTARAQTSYTQMTLTVTNAPTNGMTVSINGHLRTWTNSVTAANNQIATTNSGNASATNYWLALISYPEANLTVAFASSNQIVLTAYAGYSLSVATNAGAGAPSWLTWTTNAVTMTNATIFRYPTNAVGGIERSNAAKSLIDYLNVTTDTNAVISTLPQWVNFVNATSLAALSNYVGLVATNATNFTISTSNALRSLTLQIGLNGTNYASNLVWNLTNNSPGGYVWNALTWVTNTFGALQNNVNYHDLGNVISTGTNTILLTNTPGIYRYIAVDNGGVDGGLSEFYRSGGSKRWLINYADHTSILDNNLTQRVEVDDISLGNADTFLRSYDGNPAMHIVGQSDNVQLWEPGSMYHSEWPATLIGTATNFTADGANVSTGETAVNSFTIPGNTLTNIGDRIVRHVGLIFQASGSYEVKVYAFGNTIFDTGSFTAGASSMMAIDAEVTVDAFSAFPTGSCRYRCGIVSQTLCTNATACNVSKATGIGFGSGLVCKLGLTGPASNDVKAITDTTELCPSPAWATLP